MKYNVYYKWILILLKLKMYSSSLKSNHINPKNNETNLESKCNMHKIGAIFRKSNLNFEFHSRGMYLTGKYTWCSIVHSSPGKIGRGPIEVMGYDEMCLLMILEERENLGSEHGSHVRHEQIY